MFLSFFTFFPLFMPKSESLPSLFAQSLITKEWLWAICSRHSWQKSNKSDLLFFMSESLTKSKQFAQKTIERIPNPDSILGCLSEPVPQDSVCLWMVSHLLSQGRVPPQGMFHTLLRKDDIHSHLWMVSHLYCPRAEFLLKEWFTLCKEKTTFVTIF